MYQSLGQREGERTMPVKAASFSDEITNNSWQSWEKGV
jgi:hypothetical protein